MNDILIKEKIRAEIRRNTTYIHPIATDENIAKLISAYANGSGGDIVFGITDDSKILKVKNFKFKIDIDEILSLLNVMVNIKYGDFTYENSRLFYISVEKSAQLIRVKNKAYRFNNYGDLKEIQDRNIFISYSHKESELVDILEEKLSSYENIKITRDIKTLEYRDSLDHFMRSIRNHDFVISLVSSSYIKSLNCMYEITQLSYDINFHEKLIFIIVNSDDEKYYSNNKKYRNFEAKIYDEIERLKYIMYWNNKKKDFEKDFNAAEIDLEYVGNLSLYKQKLLSVIPSMDNFINTLSDQIGKSFNEMYEENFCTIVEIINEKE